MKTNDTTMATICREINKKRIEALKKSIQDPIYGAFEYHDACAYGLKMAMDIIREVINSTNPQTDQA